MVMLFKKKYIFKKEIKQLYNCHWDTCLWYCQEIKFDFSIIKFLV